MEISLTDHLYYKRTCLKVSVNSDVEYDLHRNLATLGSTYPVVAISRQLRGGGGGGVIMGALIIVADMCIAEACRTLVWMFCSRALNNKLNKLQERALRILYKDDISTFQKLLNKDKTVKIHYS